MVKCTKNAADAESPLHKAISYSGFVPLGVNPATVILFFGTRTGKGKTLSLPQTSCPHCGLAGHLQAEVIPHYVHLFWIPVYRLRPWRLISCNHCKKGYEASDFTEEMERELKRLEN